MQSSLSFRCSSNRMNVLKHFYFMFYLFYYKLEIGESMHALRHASRFELVGTI
jgi:hypothetical protein